MECSEKHGWTELTREKLQKLSVCPPDPKIYKKVKKNWDSIAKPLDGMGRFEEIIAKIGAIAGSEQVRLSKKAVIIFCADNGIVEEGVSQSGQEVTAAVALSMAKKRSAVGRMAEVIGADTIPVDIGINKEESIPGVLNLKIRSGTRNFCIEPAMTETETLRAIAAGIELVRFCKEKGYQLLGTGEMGIGNTTTSSAVAASLLGCSVREVTGRGAGLSDAGLLKKRRVIETAIQKYDLYHGDALSVLSCVGGLDIAGLAGMCMGGALYHVPIVLDGVISMVAALAAERLLPGCREYLIASHKGKEPAVAFLSEALCLEPVIDGQLALGEGTGAVMMFSLLDMALRIYDDKTVFSDIAVKQYERFET